MEEEGGEFRPFLTDFSRCTTGMLDTRWEEASGKNSKVFVEMTGGRATSEFSRNRLGFSPCVLQKAHMPNPI